MSQKALAQVLRQLPKTTDRRILVGTNTADDAGVYRLDKDRALVQTVDFFTPIVDDPRLYGEIAAANALSDVYAMGGRPLTALNLMGIPTELVGPDVIATILKGGAAKVREASCALVGGHTIRNPEPVYGLSVTGLISPKHLMANDRGRPGQMLVLTKPLGTGIVTTGIKRKVASRRLATRATNIMRALNDVGPVLAEKGLVKAATDITGFGLLGHLASLCRASGVSAEIETARLPVIGREVLTLIRDDCVPGGTRANWETVQDMTDVGSSTEEEQVLMADAQTSGGLLLCVAPAKLSATLAILKRHRTTTATVIGRLRRGPKPRIRLI